MKNIFRLLLFTFLLATIHSCDVVEEPFIESNPFTGVYDSDLPIRKIFLEDFTGYRCTNCPRAAKEMVRLQETYGAHIVPMSVHFGFFSVPLSMGDPDFSTEVGDQIVSAFSIPDNPPLGMVNRKIFSEGDPYYWYHEDWSTKIVTVLSENKFADVSIELVPEFNENTKELSVEVKCEDISAPAIDLKLAIYLIENHIIGKQTDGSAVVEDYEHNHVLRDGIISSDATWGESITLPLDKSYTYTLNENWVPGNCSLVAIVYNAASKEVIQAEETEIIE